MTHREIDTSLHPAEPAQDHLADGFSPPPDAHAVPDIESEPHDIAQAPQSPF